jgi:hypothetical protein
MFRHYVTPNFNRTTKSMWQHTSRLNCFPQFNTFVACKRNTKWHLVVSLNRNLFIHRRHLLGDVFADPVEHGEEKPLVRFFRFFPKFPEQIGRRSFRVRILGLAIGLAGTAELKNGRFVAGPKSYNKILKKP